MIAYVATIVNGIDIGDYTESIKTFCLEKHVHAA